MGKYDSLNRRRKSAKVSEGPHPIWRGIGCLMVVIVPVISFGLAVITMDTATRLEWPIPADFFGYISLPDILYNSRVLVPVLNAITGVENLYGYIVFTGIYTVVLGALMSFIYALAYKVVGPPVYGPLDMPPRKGPVKKYRR
jgi:hypothetical protein